MRWQKNTDSTLLSTFLWVTTILLLTSQNCDNHESLKCKQMAPEEMEATLRVVLLCGGFSALFVNYFVHNASANVSYGVKELMDITTTISHLGVDKDFFFNKQDVQEVLQTPDKAKIPFVGKRKRCRYRGHRAGCLIRIRRRWVGKLLLPSILFANVQSLYNKLDEPEYLTNWSSNIVISNVSRNRGWMMKWIFS